MKINFKCPECHKTFNTITEASTTTVYTVVDWIGKGCHTNIVATDVDFDSAKVTHYQCPDCSWHLPVKDNKELFSYLMERGMLKESKEE